MDGLESSAGRGAMKKQTETTKPFTLRQQIFSEEYLINGGNGVKAADKAGYGKKLTGERRNNYLAQVAKQNIRKYHIKAIIDAKRAEISRETLIDGVYLTNKTLDLVKKATETGKLQAALRGIEVLAKLNGAFVDNKPNPVGEAEWAKRSEKEIQATQELVQIWLNSKYNAIKQVDSVEVPQEEKLLTGGDNGEE